jgi:beta-N-acetylhexosaminidase
LCIVPTVIASLAVGACGSAARSNSRDLVRDKSAGNAASSPSLGGVPAPGGSEGIARRLSDAQLAGQRIIYSYSGRTPPPSLLTRIRKGEAAGVVFFTPNAPSRTVLRAAVHELIAANGESPVRAPLLLMIDQEGGRVRRLVGAPEASEKQLGHSANGLALAHSAGQGAGINLRSVGLNTNLAPVLDVYRKDGDFIDEYERSYGRGPGRVGELGAAFIGAQQAVGVAATAKHFPGLGAATRTQNTDEQFVTLGQSLRATRTVDEAPYRAAIAAHVRLIMLSWATYPPLDRIHPAGLSSTIVHGELRKRLGFRGLTITDSLAAGALRAFGGLPHRALLAVGAGDDLVLCSTRRPTEDSPTLGAQALSGISAGLATHTLSRPIAETAAENIIAVRENL